MVSHVALQLALRTRLLTLSVCTTGTTTLEATSEGYKRSTGSFIADGFAPGMEVTPVGFTQTTPAVITAMSATRINVLGGRSVESADSGRALTVGLPSARSWENVQFTPPTGAPYVEEQYLPGPATVHNDGYAGLTELRPMYSPRLYVPDGVDILADGAYADALLALFAPGTSLTVAGAQSVVVRADTAPYLGQRTQVNGFSTIPVTIPLSVRTTSSPSLLV